MLPCLALNENARDKKFPFPFRPRDGWCKQLLLTIPTPSPLPLAGNPLGLPKMFAMWREAKLVGSLKTMMSFFILWRSVRIAVCVCVCVSSICVRVCVYLTHLSVQRAHKNRQTLLTRCTEAASSQNTRSCCKQ